MGVKRASPGAEDAKPSLSAEDEQKITDLAEAEERMELAVELLSYKMMAPVYEKRRPVLQTIPKFWVTAMMNDPMVGMLVQHASDIAAFEYLEDVWVERDPHNARLFSVELHFKENPFFNNSILKKEYKLAATPMDEVADENGITKFMLDFSWERDVKGSSIKIDWKDPEKALTKLYPRVGEGDDLSEGGSFFNFFEHEHDPYDLGVAIADVFADAFNHFRGISDEQDSDIESDEEEEDDDDDDAEEIDLLKPRPKKQKV